MCCRPVRGFRFAPALNPNKIVIQMAGWNLMRVDHQHQGDVEKSGRLCLWHRDAVHVTGCCGQGPLRSPYTLSFVSYTCTHVLPLILNNNTRFDSVCRYNYTNTSTASRVSLHIHIPLYLSPPQPQILLWTQPCVQTAPLGWIPRTAYYPTTSPRRPVSCIHHPSRSKLLPISVQRSTVKCLLHPHHPSIRQTRTRNPIQSPSNHPLPLHQRPQRNKDRLLRRRRQRG